LTLIVNPSLSGFDFEVSISCGFGIKVEVISLKLLGFISFVELPL